MPGAAGAEVPAAAARSFPVHDWLDTHSALYALVFNRLASIDGVRERWIASGFLHDRLAVLYPEQLEILETGRRELAADLLRAQSILDARGHEIVAHVLASHVERLLSARDGRSTRPGGRTDHDGAATTRRVRFAHWRTTSFSVHAACAVATRTR